MVGNIVGEPFKKYVNNQIQVRQQVYGSGFDSTGFSREQQYLTYLNSRLSWVKMASSVIVNPPLTDNNINDPRAVQITTTSNEGLDRLSKLGFNNPEAFLGYKLASSAILFNGLQQANFDAKVNNSEGGESSIDPTIADKFNKWATRFGYSKTNSIWNQSAYGLGGTDFGLQPMPGITGVEVNHINRGSIKKATITLRAYNKFQFELIDLLYLRLGFTMLLEWGNSHYIESNGEDESGNIIKPQDEIQIGDIATVGATLTEQFWFRTSGASPLEIGEKIESYRTKYDGNYDGFVGRVSNFNWNFNPDGSYDITIQLTSLGDVVESFKVNALVNPSINETSLNKDDKNIDQITKYLSDKKEEKNINDDPNFISLDRNSLLQSIFKPDEEKYYYFIRLGGLLEFIKNNIITKINKGGGNNTFPILDINFDIDENVMAIFPNQISLDPRICMVNTTYFDPPLKSKPKLPFLADKNSFYAYDPVIHGKLMNIYLNFDFIENILKNNLDSEGNLSLYNFIKAICNGINKSLGSVNNLEPIVNEETNVLTIIDQTQFEGRDELRKDLIEDEKEIKEENDSFLINVYGYNNISGSASSNFVKSYSFQTEISPNLSTQIAIGATAAGTVVGEDATAFSQWNKGLTDKFFPSISPPPSSNITSQEELLEKRDTIQQQLKKYQDLEKGLGKVGSQDPATISVQNKVAELELKLRELNQLKEYRDFYLPYILGPSFKTTNSEGYVDNDPIYLKFQSETIARGYASWKRYFSPYTNTKKEFTTGTLGFIPINLQLELDGISGIKVYQKLKIDTKFLPSNYPDVLEFLIKQVNHSIQDNKWVTTLETISVPKIQQIPIIDQTVNELETIEAPTDLIFRSPTGKSISTTSIRTDSEGSGDFDAPRDRTNEEGEKIKGLHKGLDLLTNVGDIIYSPIPGIIEPTKAFTNSKTNGIKIRGTGRFTGYTIKIFYVNPTKLSGTKVGFREKIGTAQDLSLDYDDKVQDHIHFSVQVNKNGKTYNINPFNLRYRENELTNPKLGR